MEPIPSPDPKVPPPAAIVRKNSCCKLPPFMIALTSGGIAGFAVDVSLFPLDTIKTRLQSSEGFFKAGGFRRVFAGLGPTAAASMPCAAVFFAVYEQLKQVLPMQGPTQHMAAASVGEFMACCIRVPSENIKQKLQAGLYASTRHCSAAMWQTGGVREFYTGFGATLMREIPFSLIQFPLYEQSKVLYGRAQGRPVTSWEAALCGCFAGGVAASVTTPIDVCKTRMMLGVDAYGVRYTSLLNTFTRLAREGGTRALFAGLVPRVVWVASGGAVFFGVYEQTKEWLCGLGCNRHTAISKKQKKG